MKVMVMVSSLTITATANYFYVPDNKTLSLQTVINTNGQLFCFSAVVRDLSEHSMLANITAARVFGLYCLAI